MPAYAVTLAGGLTATVTGTRPFAKVQKGGPSGAVEVVDAAGVPASGVVYAEHAAAQIDQDALVLAANNSPVITVAPAITGTAQVGQTLTATSTMTGTAAPTKSYVWKRGAVVIAGAVAATYPVVLADLAALITVEITGTNTHGVAVQTSPATAAVIAA